MEREAGDESCTVWTAAELQTVTQKGRRWWQHPLIQHKLQLPNNSSCLNISSRSQKSKDKATGRNLLAIDEMESTKQRTPPHSDECSDVILSANVTHPRHASEKTSRSAIGGVSVFFFPSFFFLHIKKNPHRRWAPRMDRVHIHRQWIVSPPPMCENTREMKHSSGSAHQIRIIILR